MENLLATILVSCAVFGLFALALSLAALTGRARKRRCACAESKAVMKTVMERDRAKRRAQSYRPESVNPKSLPILSPELAELISPDGKAAR